MNSEIKKILTSCGGNRPREAYKVCLFCGWDTEANLLAGRYRLNAQRLAEEFFIEYSTLEREFPWATLEATAKQFSLDVSRLLGPVYRDLFKREEFDKILFIDDKAFPGHLALKRRRTAALGAMKDIFNQKHFHLYWQKDAWEHLQEYNLGREALRTWVQEYIKDQFIKFCNSWGFAPPVEIIKVKVRLSKEASHMDYEQICDALELKTRSQVLGMRWCFPEERISFLTSCATKLKDQESLEGACRFIVNPLADAPPFLMEQIENELVDNIEDIAVHPPTFRAHGGVCYRYKGSKTEHSLIPLLHLSPRIRTLILNKFRFKLPWYYFTKE